MRVKVGDKVRLKTDYYGHHMNGEQGVVELIEPGLLYPIELNIGGVMHLVRENEIHTFQDTLDEIGRVSEASNEDDPLWDNDADAEEYQHILDFLNDELGPYGYTKVIRYIDKLRENK